LSNNWLCFGAFLHVRIYQKMTQWISCYSLFHGGHYYPLFTRSSDVMIVFAFEWSAEPNLHMQATVHSVHICSTVCRASAVTTLYASQRNIRQVWKVLHRRVVWRRTLSHCCSRARTNLKHDASKPNRRRPRNRIGSLPRMNRLDRLNAVSTATALPWWQLIDGYTDGWNVLGSYRPIKSVPGYLRQQYAPKIPRQAAAIALSGRGQLPARVQNTNAFNCWSNYIGDLTADSSRHPFLSETNTFRLQWNISNMVSILG
jgi:hypothetical protein